MCGRCAGRELGRGVAQLHEVDLARFVFLGAQSRVFLPEPT
jgi:hypothetical protein